VDPKFPFGRVRHLLVELDGVLYRGNAAIPGARDFIVWLHARRISFRLVTNNATLTPGQYREKLAAMGIEASEDEFFTSSLATAAYLETQGAKGQTALVVGEDGLRQALEDSGMQLVDSHAQWVVAGLDRTLTYQKLATASLALEAGAKFVGTNPDTSFPVEAGLVPGAGAILAALSATTGKEPVVIGKPEPAMLELAMEHLGAGRQDTAMLGDRLDTDILAAQRVGIPSILVLTGVSTSAELERGDIKPDLVVENLPALMDLWQAR
jgi:4-nitrophenyl phosphatase